MNYIIVLFTIASLQLTFISSQVDVNLVRKLSLVQSTEEFLENFVRKDGQRINISYIHPDNELGDRIVVSGGEEDQLAPYDLCTPRLRTVVIPRDKDPNVIYWPSCTRIERCGGCCPTEMLECLPMDFEMVPVNVLKTRVPYPGSTNLDYEGPFPVLIQRDLLCEPMCKIKPHHCNPLQDYDESLCSCICHNYDQAGSCPRNKIWNKDECSCVCLEKKKCRGLFKFSRSTCKCEIRDVVSNEMSKEELIQFIKDHYAESNNENNSTTAVTDTTTTVSTEAPTTSANTDATSTEITYSESMTETSTTELQTTEEMTTAIPTTQPNQGDTRKIADPKEKCAKEKPCPPGWKRVTLSNGNCGCAPDFVINIPGRHHFRRKRSVSKRFIRK